MSKGIRHYNRKLNLSSTVKKDLYDLCEKFEKIYLGSKNHPGADKFCIADVDRSLKCVTEDITVLDYTVNELYELKYYFDRYRLHPSIFRLTESNFEPHRHT